MLLLDLPNEILQRIFGQLGHFELRTYARYWTICRDLYRVAHEALLLPSMRLSASQLQRPFFAASHGRVQRISVRLSGHLSGELSLTPWISDPEDHSTGFHYLSSVEDWERRKIAGAIDGGMRMYAQQAWISRINSRLHDLGEGIRMTTVLEEFMLEASASRPRYTRRGFLEDTTIIMLLNSLPDRLTALTLDTWGTETVAAVATNIHLCPFIGKRIATIKNVRLRMPCLCAEIFNIPSENRVIESLIVRLSLPLPIDRTILDGRYHTEACYSNGGPNAPLNDRNRMLAAGLALAGRHTFEMLRISFTSQGLELVVYDAIANHYLAARPRRQWYIDDGRAWGSWEDSETLQVVNLKRRGT